MQKIFTKTDALHCQATATVIKHYGNNGADSYQGKLIFSENDITLFSFNVPVERLTFADALEDAMHELNSGQFGEWS